MLVNVDESLVRCVIGGQLQVQNTACLCGLKSSLIPETCIGFAIAFEIQIAEGRAKQASAGLRAQSACSIYDGAVVTIA